MKFGEKALFFWWRSRNRTNRTDKTIGRIGLIGGIGPMRYRRQLPDLAGSFNDVFVAGQLLQTHRATGV
jgi:hypothetical protein